MIFDPCRLKVVRALAILQLLMSAMILSSAAVVWGEENPGGVGFTGTATERISSNNARSDDGLGPNMQENDADRFFRAYMLPGVTVLTLFVAATLGAIFYPRPKKE